MGILERRYGRWADSLAHFERAREIEPGCAARRAAPGGASCLRMAPQARHAVTRSLSSHLCHACSCWNHRLPRPQTCMYVVAARARHCGQLQSATLSLYDACINTSITSLVAVSAGKHGRGPRRYCEPVYWHGLTLVNHGTQAEVLRGVEARPALARGSSLAVGAPHGEPHSYGCTPRVWQSHGCG